MKSKKKVLGIYIGNFETYTRYFEVADKKKVLRGDCLFKLSKGGNLKKECRKPWPNFYTIKKNTLDLKKFQVKMRFFEKKKIFLKFML